MSILSSEEQQKGIDSEVTADLVREQVMEHAKYFKTSWVELGQALYPIWKDKLYRMWGFDKFEYYAERELGLKNGTALKLLKTYFFLEQEEPDYLNREFKSEREPNRVPDYEGINVLRMARQKKELTRDDYRDIKQSIYDKGVTASVARRELTALMKERKPVDPEEERKKRAEASVRKLLTSIKSFQKEMDALKLVSGKLLEDTKTLMENLESEIGC